MADLSKLLERIKTQLYYESVDEEQEKEKLESMTVMRLLEMLEYMKDD